MTSLSLSHSNAILRLRQFLCQIFILAVFTGGIVGCGERYSEHGQIINPADLETFQIGVSSRNDIVTRLGRPSFEGAFEKNRLYYTSQRMIEPVGGSKTVDSRTIYIFTLDDNQILQALDLKSEKDGIEVSHLDEKTPAPGDKYGALEQMFSNLRKRTPSE